MHHNSMHGDWQGPTLTGYSSARGHAGVVDARVSHMRTAKRCQEAAGMRSLTPLYCIPASQPTRVCAGSAVRPACRRGEVGPRSLDATPLASSAPCRHCNIRYYPPQHRKAHGYQPVLTASTRHIQRQTAAQTWRERHKKQRSARDAGEQATNSQEAEGHLQMGGLCPQRFAVSGEGMAGNTFAGAHSSSVAPVWGRRWE